MITRGSNTYGPNQYPEKLLPLFVTNALDGEPLPMYGDGKQTRDWLFVEDHAAGIELALRRGRAGEVYNVGGGEEATNREITDLVLAHTGADASLVRRVEDRPGHDRRYSLDTTKAREELGWEPRTRLAQGFPLTATWYAEHRTWWEPIKSSGGYREYYEKQSRGSARELVLVVPPPQLFSAWRWSRLISPRLPWTSSERRRRSSTPSHEPSESRVKARL